LSGREAVYSPPVTSDAAPAGLPERTPRSAWDRGRLLAVLAVAVALLLVLHGQVPNWRGLGSLVETFLPWLGLAVPLVLVGALVRRSATAAIAAVVPLGAWLWLFLPPLVPGPAAPDDLVVVQHNVSDTNDGVQATVDVLLAARPDVVTLVEVDRERRAEYTQAFGEALPYHETQGTVGVWSRLPLRDAEPVDLRPAGVDASWDRGLRVTVQGDDGKTLRLYAVHLPSVRLSGAGMETANRDASIRKLADALATDRAAVVVLGGDLNATLDDRALDPVTRSAGAPRHGVGFTYPADFPVVRIDHVLARGASVVDVAPLGRTGSDHLPVVAHVDLPGD
jgi:vancomycin resistance protein VanJ